MRRFALVTLGCKVNQVDGERFAADLVAAGWQPAGPGEEPGLCLVNGCAVTARASQKVRQQVRAARRRWPRSRIVLLGCEAARVSGATGAGADDAVGADDIITPGAWPAFVAGLRRAHPTTAMAEGAPGRQDVPPERHAEACDGASSPVELHERPAGHGPTEALPGPRRRTRGFLKVQDGCEHRCSYCIVPDLRGPERSVPLPEVVAAARALVTTGVREIVVTGIHLGRYRDGELRLPALLAALDGVEGLARVRLSSIEPMEVDEPLVDWIVGSPRACPHLHLPLQAGDDRILSAMRRPYHAAEFAGVVERLRRRVPGIAITTDLIVGFPGEDEGAFAAGLAFVAAQGFAGIHLFPFSPRPGTPAATLPSPVPASEKRARMQRAEAVRQQAMLAYRRSLVGRTVEVLTERAGVGHCREYVQCRLDSQIDANSIVSATITHAAADGCRGTVIREPSSRFPGRRAAVDGGSRR